MQFRDLNKQYKKLKLSIDTAIAKVLSSACFISGEQVEELETSLADYVGIKHCITCGNGTDAISISLIAAGIGEAGGGSREDAVFVPDFTFFSSGECPAAAGATPVFVDVSLGSYNMDSNSLEETIKKVISEGKLKPRAVMAVDLFGLPADYDAIRPICNKYGLLLIEDGAQGFGGSLHGKKSCSFGDIATTSFFPAKPLGCYGDGGAIFTDNDNLAALCRSIAVHGKNADNKYDNIRLGMNSRLDTLQAAILLPKLKAFKDYEIEDVNRVAAKYTELLSDTTLTLPYIPDGFYTSWAQYTVQLPGGSDRAFIQGTLKNSGIPTMVYYRKPMHRQGAFKDTDSSVADCPNTERLCESVLCLPIHPYLESQEIEMVVNELKKCL